MKLRRMENVVIVWALITIIWGKGEDMDLPYVVVYINHVHQDLFFFYSLFAGN